MLKLATVAISIWFLSSPVGNAGNTPSPLLQASPTLRALPSPSPIVPSPSPRVQTTPQGASPVSAISPATPLPMKPNEWIAMIAGTVGMITGSVACIISFISFKASRRGLFQNYFKSMWSKLVPILETDLRNYERWLFNINDEIAKYPLQTEFLFLDSNFKIPNLDDYNWKYDWNLKKLLLRYMNERKQLNNYVLVYNHLVYPLTVQGYAHLQTSGGFALRDQETKEIIIQKQADLKILPRDLEELEKIELREKERAENTRLIESIVLKYLKKLDVTVEDLSNCSSYQRDLLKNQKKIQKQISKINKLIVEIKIKIDFYNIDFGRIDQA